MASPPTAVTVTFSEELSPESTISVVSTVTEKATGGLSYSGGEKVKTTSAIDIYSPPNIQKDFVDEPRNSVEHADALVAEAMEKIERMFSERVRATLKELWIDDEDASTEDLRIVLQRYRSFFNRLLTIE